MNQYRTTIVIYCHYYQAILLALTGSMGQTYYDTLLNIIQKMFKIFLPAYLQSVHCTSLQMADPGILGWMDGCINIQRN